MYAPHSTGLVQKRGKHVDLDLHPLIAAPDIAWNRMCVRA